LPAETSRDGYGGEESTKAALTFPAPYRNLSGAGAQSVWVKGDGKGALLALGDKAVQLHRRAG